jgi:NAD(P)-dependent dehydrogenase (short-subunit alcohol dehydrogenase family)
MSHLAGRHALVTGANRGIGAEIARAFSAGGARVTLLVRHADRATAAADALSGPNATVVADVTDRAAVFDACARAADQLGPVDILVNNAGFAESAAFLRSAPDLFERMFQVHLMGAVHATQAVLPSMIQRGGGHIVNVASTAGLEGQAYVTAYVAAKHALVGLTRALALEVRKHGILVNAVCPGYADTKIVRDAVANISIRTGMSETEALRSLLVAGRQERLVMPQQVSSAVIALCTAEDAPTGQAVVIDGSGP